MYEYIATVDRVVDGDTIDISVDLGFKIIKKDRFRILHINTAEIYGVKKDSEEYKKGMESTNWLKERIENKEIIIRTYKDTQGKYGRYLCEVFHEHNNIGDEMVELGLAEYVDY